MSKSSTSDRRLRAPSLEGILWQLAQVFWVGGLWVFHVGLVPALKVSGLAPLLVQDIAGQIDRWLIGVALLGLLTQLAVLARVDGLAAWWRQFRGQMLLLGFGACVGYYTLRYGISVGERWQMFCFLVLGFSGIVLVAQPVPVRARQARHCARRMASRWARSVCSTTNRANSVPSSAVRWRPCRDRRRD